MGYICTFMDNDTYTAQNVNTALSHLTQSGVAIFQSTGDIIADLNTAISNVTSSGVIQGGCVVTVNSGVYKINAGTCFMEDGSQITFDSNGYVITPIANTKSYVYLKRDEVNNTIEVKVSASAGETGTVPLAEISSAGVITDKRKYATAKIALSSANIVRSGSINIDGRTRPTGEILRLDVGFSGFKYLVITDNFNSNYKRCIDLSDGENHFSPIYGDREGFGATLVRKEGRYLIFSSHSSTPTCIMNFEVI